MLACGTWVVLFHGIYGRMYSLFLFTSALSFLTLLAAIERGGRVRWAVWALALLAALAAHPYAALVLASQALFVVIARTRVRQAFAALASVAVLALPLWYADLVLAQRFGVGVGDEDLAARASKLDYLRRAAGDLSAGYRPVLVAVLVLAAVGFWRLARTRRQSALLAAVVLLAPPAALMAARLSGSASLESRHLIFAVPFSSMLVASGLIAVAARAPGFRRASIALGATALVGAELTWAWAKTPALFTGEPRARAEAREAASSWLAANARPDDVLFGYEPLFLGAWERSRRFPDTVLPRADGELALRVLLSAGEPLGRGLWVFDASDSNNEQPKERIPLRVPKPRAMFVARAFGPFLVVRTRTATREPGRYLKAATQVMAVGRSLDIGDAAVNLQTVEVAARRLAPDPG